VSARINHIVSMSSDPTVMGTMYESIFGLCYDESPKPVSYGEVLTDGYVNLNLHYRLPGHRLGLHHFGIEVDDMEAVLDKLKSDYPSIGWIDRPDNCPYPGYISHDPARNIFALTERSAADKASGPPTTERPKPHNFTEWSEADTAGRYVHHYAIRTRQLDECAQFYEDVFGFKCTAGKGDDPNRYLSDGHMTLMLIPWSINDYDGISVTGRGPDHIGFKVEDAAVVQQEVEDFFSHYAPGRAPLWLLNTTNHKSKESQIMSAILDNSCPMSSYQFTDSDGVFILVGDKTFGDL
jgi:catechol 2,3-dioxygenase-like lactoylglutathione lyase family enzyme